MEPCYRCNKVYFSIKPSHPSEEANYRWFFIAKEYVYRNLFTYTVFSCGGAATFIYIFQKIRLLEGNFYSRAAFISVIYDASHDFVFVRARVHDHVKNLCYLMGKKFVWNNFRWGKLSSLSKTLLILSYWFNFKKRIVGESCRHLPKFREFCFTT